MHMTVADHQRILQENDLSRPHTMRASSPTLTNLIFVALCWTLPKKVWNGGKGFGLVSRP